MSSIKAQSGFTEFINLANYNSIKYIRRLCFEITRLDGNIRKNTTPNKLIEKNI